jgi:N-dimethylarginine dimethylaminohydrolase
MPDLAFTRDVAVTTPWGLVALNPALAHRSVEVDHFVEWAGRYAGGPAQRIRRGKIEGGDVCVARPGLLIVGVSGTRTDEAGAEEFSARFAREGWDVLTCRFDEHFLHLDTIFCMLDETHALACVDALDDGFLDAVARRGIELLAVSYKESRRLGCNVLSLNGRQIVASSATPRVTALMRRHGFTVSEVELDQFSACGGGVHCLTMPLARPDSGHEETTAFPARLAG